jgi:cysteine desulfurase/selenocysteine lyase
MHYLDHACFGPPAPRTQQVVIEALTELTAVSEHDATELALEWLRRCDDARGEVGRLLDASPTDVTLVESTTHGLGVVAGGLPLRPGDNVVVADCDFVGLPTVWRSQERNGVEIRAARSDQGTVPLDQVRAAVDARTRVLAFSAVQEVSGVPLDVPGVAEIAASVGAYLMLDGIQEVGVLQRHPARDGVHAYVSGGHKWLACPYGVGLLWTSPTLRQEIVPPFRGYFALEPPDGGWPAHLDDPTTSSLHRLGFRDDGAALELGGTPNWVGAVALTEAVGGMLRIGPAEVESRAQALADRLRNNLVCRGIKPLTPVGSRSPIVTFSLLPALSAERFVECARAADIRVSARAAAGAGGVRVGCHAHNTADDLDVLLEVVDKCLGRRSG